VVPGGSAGGHLAALVALTGNDPAYQPGFEEADTAVQACVPFYGVYDLRSEHYPAETIDQFFGPIVLRASRDREPEKFAAAKATGTQLPSLHLPLVAADRERTIKTGIAAAVVSLRELMAPKARP
jgi:acetyl esterase/lipase